MKTLSTAYVNPRERGVALLVVMVALLLASIIVLGGMRTNYFNESLVGNESDYQRAYAAAEALIADAEADIRGVLPGNLPCSTNIDFVGCRNRFGGNLPFIPETTLDLDDVQARIPNFATLPCRQGICLISQDQTLGVSWWNVNLAAMTANTRTPNAIAATYGEHTNITDQLADNPLLGPDDDGVYQAWYWIEVMEFNVNQGALGNPVAANLPVPSVAQPFVYRITAVADGRRPGTRVVLRSIFVPALANNA